MEEKEFIPYEQALALKELGFNTDCFGCYTEKKEVIIRVGDYRSFLNNNSEDSIIRDFNSYENGTISAPLFSQAFRWFREKYGLDYFVKAEWQSMVKVGYYFSADKYYSEQPSHLTYEEAELECLKKLIEIVKEN